MIGKSNIRPSDYEINQLANGKSEIMFYENVTENLVTNLDGVEQTEYTFEFTEMSIDTRDGLEEDIKANYSEWVSFAKGLSGKPLSDKETIELLKTQVQSVQEDNVSLMTMLVEGGVL